MLEAQDLAARRGYSQLFAGLSFRVAAGEALVVTGANGTGKTTLLRMLAGLSAPTDGVIRWDGRQVQPFDPGLRAGACLRRPLAVAQGRADRRGESRAAGRARRGAGRARRRSTPRSTRWRSAASAACRRACCRRASGGASDSRGCACSGAGCGSSTNRSRRSTPRARRCSRAWSPSTSTSGGIAVAATHAPLGLPEERVARCAA